MRVPTCVVFVVCAGAFAGACDKSTTGNRFTGPSPISTVPSLPVQRQPVQITSGVDGTPVAGARVLINGDEYYSGPIGQVEFDPYSGASPGDPVDVDAPGFLPRKTRLTSTRAVTLWPVANDDDANAVREMVYRRGGTVDEVLRPLGPGSIFYVSLLSGATPGIVDAWKKVAQDFGAALKLQYEVTTTLQYDPNEMGVFLGGAPKCAPIPGWGFCRVPEAGDEDYQVEVERALDAATIRRLLAHRFLGPNPLPGLMNLQAPADRLSEFETRTIRMILLRRLPNQWPDTDR